MQQYGIKLTNDRMILNAEFSRQDEGDAFNGDGMYLLILILLLLLLLHHLIIFSTVLMLSLFSYVTGIVMLAIDTILWVKLCTTLLLNQYSAKGNPPYQVKEFAYALVIFFYSVLLVFFFIVEHARVIGHSKMHVRILLIPLLSSQ